MSEPTYRDALWTAWQITKEHKFLFIFGLFATFVGQLGILDLIMKLGLVGSDAGPLPLWALLPSLGLGASYTIVGFTLQTWMLLAWLAVLVIGIIVVFTFVAVTCHGALIHAIGQFINHPRKEVAVDDAWHAGVQHFWRLFAIVLTKAAVMFLLALATGAAIVNAVAYATTWDAVLFLILFVLAVIVGMVISFVAVYAAGYVVIEEYGFVQSIRSGWELFREHWLVSVEVGLTVLLLNVLASIIALASLSLLFVPTMLLWLVASGVVSSLILFQLGSFIAVGLFVLLIATLGSSLTVFTTALWMDLFQHMHRRGMVSTIHKVFSK